MSHLDFPPSPAPSLAPITRPITSLTLEAIATHNADGHRLPASQRPRPASYAISHGDNLSAAEPCYLDFSLAPATLRALASLLHYAHSLQRHPASDPTAAALHALWSTPLTILRHELDRALRANPHSLL